MLHISTSNTALRPSHQDSPQSPKQRERRNQDRRSPPQGIHNRLKTRQSELLVLDYLAYLNTPRALTVWMLFKYGEHKQVVELLIDAQHYLDGLSSFLGLHRLGIDRFRRDYAATKFLSKCVGLKTGINLEEAAIKSAEKAELQCRSTNERLRRMFETGDVSPLLGAAFFRAEQIIFNILGEAPPLEMKDVGWSSGRDSSAFGPEATSVHKYTSQLDVTLSAWPKAIRLVQASPNWGSAALDADGPVSVLQRAFHVVAGNTMITVPKNAKTDRIICYEPHMNIRLQKAVGGWMKYRLLKHGIDLSDQSVNQRRARLGSKTGHLSTIDLSMASDTLSLLLVQTLLPVKWYLYLDSLRSKNTLWPDGSTRENDKFSSMGNGFTFELESLIFYALASAVATNVSVYGDDIIVPTESFENVKSVLEGAGFILNQTKSFSVGLFRESCGYDGFCGVNCTPVYLRRLPKTTEDVIKLHNAVREWAGRDSIPSARILPLLAHWRTSHTCPIGPFGYGDGHYHVDFDTASPNRAGAGIDGWWFKSYCKYFYANTVYGDRVSGRYSGRYGWGALCASTGPKSPRDIRSVTDDRRQFKYVLTRVLASFCWPTISWDASS